MISEALIQSKLDKIMVLLLEVLKELRGPSSRSAGS